MRQTQILGDIAAAVIECNPSRVNAFRTHGKLRLAQHLVLSYGFCWQREPRKANKCEHRVIRTVRLAVPGDFFNVICAALGAKWHVLQIKCYRENIDSGGELIYD